MFIFISGFTASLVYGRALATRGALIATVQVLRRAWQLYVAHIFLFMIFIAEVSYTVRAFNNPMYNEEMGVGDFLEHPHIAVVQAMLLQFQPTFLDILPLYIVLLLIFPLVLFCSALAAAGGADSVGAALPRRAGVRHRHAGLSARHSSWIFNPLAWQFLFILGAVLGHAETQPRGRARLVAARLLAGARHRRRLFTIRMSWTFHGFLESVPDLFARELWPTNKSNLSPIRLVSFFALVMLAARWVSPQARFMRATAARPLVLCGRHSLEIFCLSILLSALGHFLMSEINTGLTMQLGVNVVGIAIMCLTAGMLDWYRAVQRMPVTTAGQ